MVRNVGGRDGWIYARRRWLEILGEEMVRNMGGGGDGQKYQRNVWLEMLLKGMVRITEEMVGKGDEEMVKTTGEEEGQNYQKRRRLEYLEEMVSLMKVKVRNIGVGDRQYFWWLTRKLEIVEEEILQLELLECRRIFTEIVRGDGQKILLQDVAKRVR